MREKERIKRILILLEEIWNEVPELRLGQLLYNLADFHGDIFYIEDDVIEKKLQDALDSYRAS